jgi:hypothetical protein
MGSVLDSKVTAGRPAKRKYKYKIETKMPSLGYMITKSSPLEICKPK